MKLPPETCADCGKVIKGTGRANVFDDRIVCTPCWRKFDEARQYQQRWNGPASDAQKTYASDLGLRFADDATWGQLHDVLTRHVDYGGDDVASEWLQEYARQCGIPTTAHSGSKRLYDCIFNHFSDDDYKLARWFVYNVSREIAPRLGRDISAAVIDTVAAELVANPKAVASMRKYDGSSLLDFGAPMPSRSDQGYLETGASKRTIAYSVAREGLLRALTIEDQNHGRAGLRKEQQ